MNSVSLFQYSQTSGLLFLIDCSPSMFVKKEDDENAFDKCLRCIKNMFQKKVITNEKDVFAVVLYGLVSTPWLFRPNSM